jgi:opine dehydrogenase
MSKSYAVIGAGNGGYAMAGELALLGRDIVLFDFPAFEGRLSPLRKAGGVRVDSRIDHFPGGRGEHFAPLPQITTDISGIASADVVIVVVPGQHHEKVIAAALPHLRDGQLVLLNPGGVGGCLVWASALQKAGRSGVLLAQPADLLYAGYRTNDGRVIVADKKKQAVLGVFPNCDRDRVLSLLEDFPEFSPGTNVLEAGMGGPGMLVHPLPMIMNAVRIDRDAPFKYDAYDITRSVANAIDGLDRERTAIIEALGGRPVPIKDVLTAYYGVSGADFFETVRKVPAYLGATAPADFTHRYIAEEVPTQIVPTAGIGRALGLETRMLDSVTALAGAINGEDYERSGWTVERLGIAGLSRDALLAFLDTGWR